MKRKEDGEEREGVLSGGTRGKEGKKEEGRKEQVKKGKAPGQQASSEH
jgi:hypothetical protein